MGVLPVYMSVYRLHAVTTEARRMCHECVTSLGLELEHQVSHNPGWPKANCTARDDLEFLIPAPESQDQKRVPLYLVIN